MNIRKFEPKSDVKKIVETLYTKYNTTEGIEKIKSENKLFIEEPQNYVRIVAENDVGKLVSSIVAIRSKNNLKQFTLHSLVTTEEYRGTGLSLQTTNFMLEIIKDLNGEEVLTSTFVDNIAANKFLTKIKFKPYGKQTSEDGIEEILYRKYL